MASFLNSILPWITGSQQQPSAALTQQATSIPGYQPPSGFEKMLSNPLVEGALTTYLGAIGSPRKLGLGAAISRGGLAGLGAFERAEQDKLKVPLLVAQMSAQQAKTGEEQAQTGYLKAKTKQLGGSKDDAAQMILLSQNPAFSPASRAIFQSLASAVGTGHIKFIDAFKLAQSGDLNAAHMALARAQTKHTEALTGEIPLQERELSARTTADLARAGQASAEASAVPSLIKERTALAAKASRPEEPKGPSSYAAGGREYIYDPAMRGYRDVGAAEGTMPKPADSTLIAGRRLSNLDKSEKDYHASRNPIARALTSDNPADLASYRIQQGLNPKTGEALPKLDPGYSYTGKLSRKGNPVVMAPDGSLHEALLDSD